MPLSLSEARRHRLCRVCEQAINLDPAVQDQHLLEHPYFLLPEAITLDYGKEFAHTRCLQAREKAEGVGAGWDYKYQQIQQAVRDYLMGEDSQAARQQLAKTAALDLDVAYPEVDVLRRRVLQLEKKLEACGVAARGHALGDNDARPGGAAWSQPFAEVKALRAELDRLKAANQRTAAEQDADFENAQRAGASS